MKKLDEKILKIGDVILTASTAAVSKAIRTATRSDVSHAMIYVEDRSIIDATAEGVQARNTQRLFFDDDCAIYVLRLKGGLTEGQACELCAFVRARVGAQYSKAEAIRSVLGGANGWTRKQFCSRLVAQAYASVGIALVGDPNYCSPADIKDCPDLVQQPSSTVPVTFEEAARFEELTDTTQMMREATNAVLDAARTKCSDIQSFSDLNLHLFQYPEDDEFICNALKSSGYLTLWQIEKDKNPWQYDLSLMNAVACQEEINEYCWNLLGNQSSGFNRYIITRGHYIELAKRLELGAFHFLAELYDGLAELHAVRVETAGACLEARGLLEPAEDIFFRPHTSEWFATLKVWDPTQAAHTARIVELAGNLNVCSVCGDDPAHDYRLAHAYRAAGSIDTLRLCDDCLGIRRNNGEPFELVV